MRNASTIQFLINATISVPYRSSSDLFDIKGPFLILFVNLVSCEALNAETFVFGMILKVKLNSLKIFF